MSNSNKHIKEFLNYYLNKEQSPDYAVLITGCWGSGKTYFIRQYLDSKGAAGKNVVKTFDWLNGFERYTVVYVSLFGAKTRDDINENIERILHPKINSKKFEYLPDAISLVSNLSGIAVGTTVAATTTIATGGSMAPYAVPAGVAIGSALGNFFKNLFSKKKNKDVFTSDFIDEIKNKKKRLVVVFDDVERADMPLPELLGYLNEYVEHLHVPCILLADKDKWEEAQKCQEDKSTLHHLSSTKEKVIGKEFQIQTSFDEVWNVWFDEEKHFLGDKVWRLLNEYHDVIAQVFELSETTNYRSLKHSLFDFQRFVENIQNDFLTNPEFNSLLIADFFAHQYAYYLGMFSATDVGQSNAWQRGFAEAMRKRTRDKQENIEEKYPLLPYETFEKKFQNLNRLTYAQITNDYYKQWLQIWEHWFKYNWVNSDRLNEIVYNSIWFKQKDNYYLNKMYEWFMLDDESGNKAMNAFEKALETKTLNSPISIMCLCSKLYWLAQRNVFKEDYIGFCHKMESYVNLAKNELLYENVDDWTQHTMLDSSYSECAEKLNDLQAILKNIMACKKEEHKQRQIELFLANLLSENQALSEHTCEKLEHEHLDEKDFNLCDIKPEQFCEIYRKIKTHNKTRLFNALGRRYKRNPTQKEIEKSFLQNVLKNAQNIYDNAERPLTPSIFAFYYLIRTIKEILGEKENVA